MAPPHWLLADTFEAIVLLFEMERRSQPPPFDKLKSSGRELEIFGDLPFVLGLWKNEQGPHGTSHLEKL